MYRVIHLSNQSLLINLHNDPDRMPDRGEPAEGEIEPYGEDHAQGIQRHVQEEVERATTLHEDREGRKNEREDDEQHHGHTGVYGKWPAAGSCGAFVGSGYKGSTFRCLP